MAAQYNFDTYGTNAFYDNGAVFNKWAALEEGLDVLGRKGWICLMDADVVWPEKVTLNLEPGKLYSPLRRMHESYGQGYDPKCPKCFGNGILHTIGDNFTLDRRTSLCDCRLSLPPERDWWQFPIHRNIAEWAGYTQIFHADDLVLGQPPWHEVDWKHAGGADSFFQAKWKLVDRIRPEWEVLHLGPAGTNWCGRATPYLDGTVPEGAEEKRKQVHEFFSRRRGRDADRFAHEKIQKPT